MNLNKALLFILLLIGISINTNAQDTNFRDSEKDTTSFVLVVQDPQLNIVNKLYKEVSAVDTITQGFKIQIYYGSRQKASQKLDQFKTLYPSIEANLIYEEPNFKAVVGKYYIKLDADRDLQMIKQKFFDAFIVRNDIIK
ncbi:MAG: hypothetical protein KAH10_08450 [Flavobacteriales bacterium]|nr:hypothetical protein [Flavobacteriales bacterium]